MIIPKLSPISYYILELSIPKQLKKHLKEEYSITNKFLSSKQN